MSTKEKKLAIALAGGLIISNLGVVTASANTNVLKEALVEQNKQNNFPTITQQTIKFDNNNSKDLVITGVDYFNQKLTKFTISYGENRYELNVDKLVYNDSEKTLTIPYEELKALNLTNGMYPCVLMFSDQTLSVGAITINVINSNTSINKPNVPELPPSNGGEEVKPPSNEGNNKISVWNKYIVATANGTNDKRINIFIGNFTDFFICQHTFLGNLKTSHMNSSMRKRFNSGSGRKLQNSEYFKCSCKIRINHHRNTEFITHKVHLR